MAIREAALRTDEAIKSDVVDQLRWDGRIDASDVSVTVDDGAVKLSGKVPTYTAKNAAVASARLVRGTIFVEDDLKVQYTPTTTIPDDTTIRSNIIDMLNWDPDLNSYTIDVTVDNGWVTLEGTVDSYWEKIQAANKAEDVRGVLGVKNMLAVVPTTRITDEVIAEDIMEALDRNIHVVIDNIDVKVTNGEVTLTGTVPTIRARTAAYNSARYTLGVVDVQNNLIVSSAA